MRWLKILPDPARQLTTLGGLLQEHWSALAPLQASQQSPAQRLTEQSPTEFQRLGSRIARALATGVTEEQAAEVSWRQELNGIYQLLQEDYELVRHPAIFVKS